MKLHSESFPDQGVIPERNAFARVDPQTHGIQSEFHKNPQHQDVVVVVLITRFYCLERKSDRVPFGFLRRI